MKNIVIIGGGNIGSAILADLAYRQAGHLTLCTKKAAIYPKVLKYLDSVTGESYLATNYKVTADYREALTAADLVFITVPAFLRKETIESITTFVKPNTTIGFIPGSGGVEFLCANLLNKGCTIFGLDRVPFISRINPEQQTVSASKKQAVRLAALPQHKTNELVLELGHILGLTCEPLKNYLTVTLTPSNQILHTSRLYSLFKNYNREYRADHNFLFYGEWDLASSEMLLACDNELQTMCRSLAPLDLSGVIPLSIHYESPDALALTKKISSIKSLANITSPMKQEDSGWVPDFSSRYFSEDFPFGLCLIKNFATICQIPTPNIDNVLAWYYSVCQSGPALDLAAQGFNTKEDIINFYLK